MVKRLFSSRVAFALAALGTTVGLSAPVAVVKGDLLGEGGASAKEAAEYANNVIAVLKVARIPYATTADTVVEKQGLGDCRLAILPYNRAPSEGEVAKLLEFASRGGKLIVFYVAPPAVLRLLGIRVAGVWTAEDGALGSIALSNSAGVTSLPAGFDQRSWTAQRVTPLTGTRVLGEWRTTAGESTGLPAVTINEHGAYFSHVLLPGDTMAKARCLRAIIGHFRPEIWRELWAAGPRLGAIAQYKDLEALAADLTRRERFGEPLGRSLDAVEVARQLEASAAAFAARGKFERAVAAREQALSHAYRALYAAVPSKPGELRGVWFSYYGVPTWEQSCALLAQHNFNAVYPWVMTAGTAYYESRLLPVHPTCREHGDYLAEAVTAGERHGIAVHARMINLMLLDTSAETRAAYERQSRLMKTASGKLERWLCPSNSLNRQLEINAAVELASNYDIAGLQFDYFRYPGKNCCFCWACRQQFEAQLGRKVAHWPEDVTQGALAERYQDFRRTQLTSLVGEIVRAVRQARPDIIISAAVFLNWERHRRTFGQDWVEWIKRGYVDYVCPMDYTADDVKLAEWVRRQVQWVGGRVPLCVGLGPFADSVDYDGPTQLLRQIELSRELGGDGFVVFNYTPAFAEKYLPVLSEGATRRPSRFALQEPRFAFQAKPGAARGGVRECAVSMAWPGSGGPPPDLTYRLRVYHARGWPASRRSGWEARQGSASGTIRLGPGVYRLVAEALVPTGNGRRGAFVQWGPTFEVAP